MSVDPLESASEPSGGTDSSGSPEHVPGTRQRFVIYMAISYCTMQTCIYLFNKWIVFSTDLSAEMAASVAGSIAIVLVSLMNFFWLMHFVYRTAHGHRWQQFWKYLQSIVGFRIWEIIVLYLMVKLLGEGDLDLLIAATIMQAQSVLMKYIVYKKLIFRAKPSAEHDEELAVHAAPPDFTDE